MPSKYYNPRLARNAGSAQDAGYTSVSGVIDDAFEPFEEQMAIRQERLFQEKERERKQKEQYEKDSAKYYESMAGLEGQIDPGHQEDFREHLQARFAETKACMDKNIGDPVAVAKCKGGLSTEINTIANTYSSWRQSNNDRLAHEKEFGVSEVNDEKDIEMANRILNIGNEKVDFSTGKPRTYRVDENGDPIMKKDAEGKFIVDENGFGEIDYFDFAEEAKNYSLIDNSGTDVHHTLMGTIGKQIDADLRDNTDPKIGMMMLDKSLKTVTPRNALHILSTELKIAGAEGELNRFFRDAERNDTSTGIYFDMPDDLDPSRYKAFWAADDETRQKDFGAVKIQGERAIVELAKDQYRFAYAQTMQTKIDERTKRENAIKLANTDTRTELDKIKTNTYYKETDNFLTEVTDKNFSKLKGIPFGDGNIISAEQGEAGNEIKLKIKVGQGKYREDIMNINDKNDLQNLIRGYIKEHFGGDKKSDDTIAFFEGNEYWDGFGGSLAGDTSNVFLKNNNTKNNNNYDDETPERKALIKALEKKYGNS